MSKHPMIVHTTDPLNSGPDLQTLSATQVTPVQRFFTRTHGSIPIIDPHTFALHIDGLVHTPLCLTLADLRAHFTRSTVMATLQCAGQRRDELLRIAPMPGEVPWGGECVSNGAWTGYRLADILAAAGVAPGAAHVALTGLDVVERDGRCFGFGGSIPLAKALESDVLLADTLNGEPLPPEHGAPLRLVVPGYIGARSVKWLGRITLQDQPSTNFFQQKAYRLFRDDQPTSPMLGPLPLQALITNITRSQRDATLQIFGLAFSGTTLLDHIEVTTDGHCWQRAMLSQELGRWAWRAWVARIDGSGVARVGARAWDTVGNTQPDDPATLWNRKGYMNNAVHWVDVEGSIPGGEQP